MDDGLISVVLPTYNRVDCLPEAINSVLQQSYRNFELLVVNDASSDDTMNYLRTLQDERVRVIDLPVNGGAARARNIGIQQACGEWVAFQDSDDCWLPDRLEQQIKAVRSIPDAHFVIGGYLLRTSRGEELVQPQGSLALGSVKTDILDGWPIITPVWLVRRQLLIEYELFDESFACFEDWDLILRISREHRIDAVSGPLLIKENRNDSVCNNRVHLRDSLAQILQRHEGAWEGQSGRLARRLIHLGVLNWWLGDRQLARQSFKRAAKNGSLVGASFFLASYVGTRLLAKLKRLFPAHAGMSR